MEIVVFTNGCFDILHPGHIELLQKARKFGTKLIVGLNSDRSVRAIKGSPRPFLNEMARAFLLSELRSVDEVRIFDENTPERLIREIKPDVLVKGGDWTPEQIVGGDFVLKNGGKVFSIPFESNFSSSKIVKKIKDSEKKNNFDSLVKNTQSALVKVLIEEYIQIFLDLLKHEISSIYRCANLIGESLKEKKKILICADDNESILSAQKFADYFTTIPGDENSFIVLKLNTENSNSTSYFEFDRNTFEQFSNEIQTGDLLIGVSTNKNSAEIISAIMQARQMNCKTIAITGAEAKKIASVSDANVSVNSFDTVLIRTAFAAVFHILREIIEVRLKESKEI